MKNGSRSSALIRGRPNGTWKIFFTYSAPLTAYRCTSASAEVAPVPGGALVRGCTVLCLDRALDHLSVEADDEDEALQVEEELHGLEHLKRVVREAPVEVVNEDDDTPRGTPSAVSTKSAIASLIALKLAW